MDMLEDDGVIAPSDGTNRPREVIGMGGGGMDAAEELGPEEDGTNGRLG